MANLYEILTVINPNESDEGVEAIIGGLRQQLTSSGGTVLAVEAWGRRKLAYPIGKHDEGHYALIWAEGGANIPAEFRAHTKVRESILRELVTRLTDAHEADVRKHLEERGPEDQAVAAAQIAAASQRAIDKRAAMTAAMSGTVVPAEKVAARVDDPDEEEDYDDLDEDFDDLDEDDEDDV